MGLYEGRAFLRYIAETTNRRRAGTTSKPGRSCFGIAAIPVRSRLNPSPRMHPYLDL